LGCTPKTHTACIRRSQHELKAVLRRRLGQVAEEISSTELAGDRDPLSLELRGRHCQRSQRGSGRVGRRGRRRRAAEQEQQFLARLRPAILIHGANAIEQVERNQPRIVLRDAADVEELPARFDPGLARQLPGDKRDGAFFAADRRALERAFDFADDEHGLLVIEAGIVAQRRNRRGAAGLRLRRDGHRRREHQERGRECAEPHQDSQS
jgi:hypothetical protein